MEVVDKCAPRAWWRLLKGSGQCSCCLALIEVAAGSGGLRACRRDAKLRTEVVATLVPFRNQCYRMGVFSAARVT